MNFENLLPSRFGRNWTFVPGRRPLVVGAESISKKREGRFLVKLTFVPRESGRGPTNYCTHMPLFHDGVESGYER